MIKHALPKPIPLEFRRDLTEGISMLSDSIATVELAEEGNQITGITVTLKANASINQAQLQTLVEKVGRDVAQTSRKVTHETLHENTATNLSTNDPHPALFEKKNLLPAGRGQFVIQGELADLFETMDASFRKDFEAWGCKSQKYPLLVEAKPLFELNYFQTMGHHIFFPQSVRGDYEVIENFTKRNSRQTNTARELEMRQEEMGKAENIISPTVCYHCFQALNKRELHEDDLAYTAMNHCLREERSAVTGLERLQCFHMREAIFINSKEKVAEQFARCVEWVKETYGKKLGLQFRIRSANDPFFGNVGSQSQIFQSALKLKYEIQVYLPYVDKYIACGSVNNHMGTMAKAFNFSVKGISEPASMCLGIGYERLALALMAQKGKGPEEIAKLFA